MASVQSYRAGVDQTSQPSRPPKWQIVAAIVLSLVAVGLIAIIVQREFGDDETPTAAIATVDSTVATGQTTKPPQATTTLRRETPKPTSGVSGMTDGGFCTGVDLVVQFAGSPREAQMMAVVMNADFMTDERLTQLVGDLKAAPTEATQYAILDDIQERCDELGLR